MEYSVDAYLERLTTEQLIAILRSFPPEEQDDPYSVAAIAFSILQKRKQQPHP